MAGAGTRFVQAGYTTPKPFILVNGKPIIRHVMDSLHVSGKQIFVMQREHTKHTDLMLYLWEPRPSPYPDPIIVVIDGLTEGAACSALLAKDYIDTDESLLIVDSDTVFDWDSIDFLWDLRIIDPDGCIVTCTTSDPSKSFVEVDHEGVAIRTAEKKPISNNGAVGIYYWRHGHDFVRYAEQMIAKNLRVNNEFYICPVYNEAIADNKVITIYPIPGVYNMGTPDDVKKSAKKLWGIDL
jgi:dTDP-glucose pyrophosphorylase